MNFISKSFNDLSIKELHDILKLRAEVFIVEQDCVYQDIDGKDEKALHVIGFENNNIEAYARIFKPGDYFQDCAIGRVVVSKEKRAGGAGKALMKASINAAEKVFTPDKIAVSAQTYLRKFYNDLGFYEVGEEYLEDGIPHIKMIRKK